MAKHGKRGRGRFRRYLKGQIDNVFGLGTLAGNTVAADLVDDVVTEKAWLSSVKASWSMDNFTEATDVGPVMCGISHGDYSATEIEEWIENLSSWEEGDLVAKEISQRKIRRVGVFAWVDSTATGQYALNEGRAITTKCGWMLMTGQTVRIWAYNMGTGALATTAPNLHTQGHANLWPQ